MIFHSSYLTAPTERLKVNSKRKCPLSTFHFPLSTPSIYRQKRIRRRLFSTRRWIVLSVLLTTFSPASILADKLTVVASIFPLYDFVTQVGGDRIDATILIPSGSEPHSWDPKPSDIVRLSRADIFLYIGDDMEPWARRILGSFTADGPAVMKADMLASSSVPEGGVRDPHLWLDLSNSIRIVEEIAVSLSKLDPSNETYFRTQADGYITKLKDLDDRFTRVLSTCGKRTFVTGGHGAFGYLAARYNLTQVPVYGLSPDSEPSPRYVAGIIRRIRQDGIKVVYFEELISPRLAEIIARETGAETLLLHPGGNLTASQWTEGMTFLSLMEDNLKNLGRGLECDLP